MPDVGDLWIKTQDGWTKTDTKLMFRNGTGWVRAQVLWKKTGASAWTAWYSRDTIPPAKPTQLSFGMIGTTLNVTGKAPADFDVVKLAFAWSTSAYPATPGVNTTYVTAKPTTLHTLGFPGQKYGTVYYWSVWAIDSAGNVSLPLSAKYTIPRIYVPPAPVTKKGTFYPTDSASYNAQSDYWRSDNNYVYQGGYDWHGTWFYGTRITGALARARSVTKMTITITRANTAHGVPGPASVYVSRHTMASQISGDPSAYDTSGIYVGTLNRGETKTFTVPSAYYPYFASRQSKGLGLYYGPTSFTDARYLYALGAGSASSGKVYIEWTE